MRRTKLVVRDQCNVTFEGLDPSVRRKMNEALKFVIPNARYMPSVKLGRWDGTVSFCTIAGNTFVNLLERVVPIVQKAGYNIEVDDRRPAYDFKFPAIDEQIFADRMWPTGHTMAGEPIILRDYQVEAARTFLINLQGIQQIATAAGKTLLTASLSCLVEPYGRSIVIVPSKTLVIQTEEDYRNLGLDVGVLFGERKEWGHQHTIATWQSLSNLDKNAKAMEYIEGVVCVMVDEVHSAVGKVLRELLTGPFAHVPIRWGLTGTVPKEEHEAICLLAGIGPVVGKILAVELQEKGVLANCQVEIVQLEDAVLEFADYHGEHDFLVTDPLRLQHIANRITEWNDSGSTLVLVDRIESGEMLEAMLPNAVFISGDTKLKHRQTAYKSVQTTDQQIIIATYGVASVGINVPRIFNLVLLEPGKSFVRVIQSIGRGLRRAKDKDYIRIIDLCSTLKFSRRLLGKRKPFYIEAEYPHHLIKESYR